MDLDQLAQFKPESLSGLSRIWSHVYVSEELLTETCTKSLCTAARVTACSVEPALHVCPPPVPGSSTDVDYPGTGPLAAIGAIPAAVEQDGAELRPWLSPSLGLGKAKG